MYVVTSSTSKLVSGDAVNGEGGSNVIKVIATIVIVGIAVFLIYMSRDKILGLFKK